MIYFVKFKQYVKIGHTRNPIKRFSSIQTSLPEKLEVLGLIEGNIEDENKIHNRFSDKNTHGEWFLLDEDILKFIEHLPDELMWEYGFIESYCNEVSPITKLRLKENLSLKDLGDLIGITAQSVHKMEKNAAKGSITINSMYKIAKAMDYKFQFRFYKSVNL